MDSSVSVLHILILWVMNCTRDEQIPVFPNPLSYWFIEYIWRVDSLIVLKNVFKNIIKKTKPCSSLLDAIISRSMGCRSAVCNKLVYMKNTMYFITNIMREVLEMFFVNFFWFSKWWSFFFFFFQMPKVQYRSNCKPSTFAYPAPLEVPKEKEKEKVSLIQVI